LIIFLILLLVNQLPNYSSLSLSLDQSNHLIHALYFSKKKEKDKEREITPPLTAQQTKLKDVA